MSAILLSFSPFSVCLPFCLPVIFSFLGCLPVNFTAYLLSWSPMVRLSAVWLSALPISTCPFVFQSACLLFWSPLVRLSASLLVCSSDLPGLSVCQSACLPFLSPLVCLSASLLVCPSYLRSVCLPVCLSAHGTVRLFSSVVDSYGYNRLIMEANKICRSAHYPVKLDSPWGVDQGRPRGRGEEWLFRRGILRRA